MTKMTTSKRAARIKFHIEYMLLMMACGRIEEAQQHVDEALGILDYLIDMTDDMEEDEEIVDV